MTRSSNSTRQKPRSSTNSCHVVRKLDNTPSLWCRCGLRREWLSMALQETQRPVMSKNTYEDHSFVRKKKSHLTFHSQPCASSPDWNGSCGWSPSLPVPPAPPADGARPCSHRVSWPAPAEWLRCDYCSDQKACTRSSQIFLWWLKVNSCIFAAVPRNWLCDKSTVSQGFTNWGLGPSGDH